MLAVPVDVMTRYQHVTISADVMFINKVAIFVTISHVIWFGTAEMIQNRKTSTFVECMQHVQNIYTQRGFKLHMAVLDGEFETIHGPLATMGVGLNCTAEDEHAPIIEQYI